MAQFGETVVRYGHVESIEDGTDGLRIRVRLKQDGEIATNKLPYAFPLLPKTFQSIPKVGEGVFVFVSDSDNTHSDRYYIGPIISQPQYLNKCRYDHGNGAATTFMNGSSCRPVEAASHYAEVEGAFPKKSDVAVLGRAGQDIILRQKNENSEEIDIRCGIRKGIDTELSNHATDYTAGDFGRIMFNDIDPAYIQLKYQTGISSSANSLVNIVANKINLVGNDTLNGINTELADKDELIASTKIDSLMAELHQLPHGDTLVELLELFRNAFKTHSHKFNDLPPTIFGYISSLYDYDINSILSNDVRIS